EPFLVVGFADALGGEVEVVEDFFAGVETVPGRFTDDVGDQVAAWLMCWPGALQPLADVKFHGNPTPQGELTSLEDFARIWPTCRLRPATEPLTRAMTCYT